VALLLIGHSKNSVMIMMIMTSIFFIMFSLPRAYFEKSITIYPIIHSIGDRHTRYTNTALMLCNLTISIVVIGRSELFKFLFLQKRYRSELKLFLETARLTHVCCSVLL